MYVSPNFKTKKAVKEALAAGKVVTVFQPNELFPSGPINGRVTLEGPHYPAPHSWYGVGQAVDGKLVSIK